jgi:hypothetical protein
MRIRRLDNINRRDRLLLFGRAEEAPNMADEDRDRMSDEPVDDAVGAAEEDDEFDDADADDDADDVEADEAEEE